ncbi:MAG: CPBP family intramembrane metalloprotease [Lachnospiraceae bacterium]|nr:CPBP family intramembrane metalloprotease [Lachnospiraceae bacterium]
MAMKRYAGILSTIILTAFFIGFSIIGRKCFDGAAWFTFSSVLRLIFGCISIFLLHKIYGRSLKDIFTNYSPKTVFICGLGFFIYVIYFVTAITLGYFPVEITGLTVSLLLSRILFQQLTTGFFEEALNRGLLLEGFYCSKMSKINKVAYASVSFILFGLGHVISGWNTYTFLYTGTIGFVFATIYLNTHNLILPMILHFIYDIPANIVDYMKFNDSAVFNAFYSVNEVMVGVMFVISLGMLLKGKNVSKTFEQEK